MPKSPLYVCVTNGFRVSRYVHAVLLLEDKQKQCANAIVKEKKATFFTATLFYTCIFSVQVNP